MKLSIFVLPFCVAMLGANFSCRIQNSAKEGDQSEVEAATVKAKFKCSATMTDTSTSPKTVVSSSLEFDPSVGDIYQPVDRLNGRDFYVRLTVAGTKDSRGRPGADPVYFPEYEKGALVAQISHQPTYNGSEAVFPSGAKNILIKHSLERGNPQTDPTVSVELKCSR